MAHRLAARFLDSAAGRIHLTEWIPERPEPERPVVLLLPPFAEEMNRSRRMFACQARALAARGFGVATFDPFGTGDSEGDFAAADWKVWLADTKVVIEELYTRGARTLGVLALRSGALLAMDAFRAASGRISHAVFWAPVIEGRTLVRQLLRLHAASFMSMERGGSVARSLEERLASGETVEIAGYAINPQLVNALQQLNLRELGSARPPPIDWVEVTAADQPAPPASVRCTETLVGEGVRVRLNVVHDEPFWSLPEITIAPRLAAMTTELIVTGLGA